MKVASAPERGVRFGLLLAVVVPGSTTMLDHRAAIQRMCREGSQPPSGRVRIHCCERVATVVCEPETFRRIVPFLPDSYRWRAERQILDDEKLQHWTDSPATIQPIMKIAGKYVLWTQNLPLLVECLRRAGIQSDGTWFVREENQQIVVDDECLRLAAVRELAVADSRSVMFVVRSEAHLQQIAAVLRSQFKDDFDEYRGVCPIPKHRVAVATIRGGVSVDRVFDRIVFPYWGTGDAERMFPVICDSHVQSLIMVRTTADQLSCEDIEDLTTFVGPILEDRSHRPAVIIHSFAAFGGNSSPRAETRGHDRRTKFYERHRSRNRYLSSWASELIEDLSQATPLNRCVLLAATIPHCDALASLLPGWPVLKAESRLLVLPPQSIASLPAALEMHSRKIFDPTHLIVAMGGPPGSWFGHYLADRRKGNVPLHLFDLTDEFCQDAKEWAEARKQMYKNLGSHWRPISRDQLKRVGKAARRRSPRPASESSIGGASS